MDNYTPSYVRRVMGERGLSPLKKFGQNFLTDDNILEKIVSTVCDGDAVLEIGAGLGAVTERLARSHRVLAYEIDDGLFEILTETFRDNANVQLIHADALRRDITADVREYLQTDSVYVCANLPYYITTALIMELMEIKLDVTGMSLMMQREVADRLTAPPGSRNYGGITAAVSYFCEVKPLWNVPPTCFWPSPEIGSAIVSFLPRECDRSMADAYLATVRVLFAQRRKTIENNLIASGITRDAAQETLRRAGVDPALRAEALSPEAILAIARERTAE